MKTTRFLGALALTLIPCAALATDTSPPTAPATGTDEGPPPGEVLTKLHHANEMEIEAGKLALEKGQSKAIKDYGKTLVRDHTAADKQVMALAKQLKVEFETMPAMKNAKLEAAKSATGPEFDQMFAEAMLEDHTKDVAEATAARDATKNPKLKRLLTALVPKLEKHKATALKLAKSPTAAGAAATGAHDAGAHGASGTAGTPPAKAPKAADPAAPAAPIK